MIKKKALKKTTARKTAKKISGKKQPDAAEVREQIAGIVKSGAKGIAEAVMDQAMHGELAPAKYLFEMAGVYPPVTDGSLTSSEEESLAKTLLHRLNIPEEPVVADQDEGNGKVGDSGAKPSGEESLVREGNENSPVGGS